eukprot:jgi/Psemu1/44791/gm1.44791_g
MRRGQLDGLDCTCYIDDMGIWTNQSFDHHLRLLDNILSQFAANRTKCNPLKCSWMVKETDFLGHWMTPEGIKPWKKKIDAVLKMGPPQNITQVQKKLTNDQKEILKDQKKTASIDKTMNTQFPPCIQYERTFDVTEDHDSHELVVDYAPAQNRSAWKKNIRRVQNLEVEEVLYTYDIFVSNIYNPLGMAPKEEEMVDAETVEEEMAVLEKNAEDIHMEIIPGRSATSTQRIDSRRHSHSILMRTILIQAIPPQSNSYYGDQGHAAYSNITVSDASYCKARIKIKTKISISTNDSRRDAAATAKIPGLKAAEKIPGPAEAAENKNSNIAMNDAAPTVLLKIKTIQGVSANKPYTSLCDSSDTKTMINSQFMPFGVQPEYVRNKRIITTSNGAFDTSMEV